MNHILIFDFIIVLLIFLRILAAFLAAPIFNNEAIPVLAKIFLAFVIAYIIFLVRDNSAVKVETGLFWLFINAGKEIITGLLIGYS
jgi:flagellar biosynthesis protein FliR